MVEHDYSSGLLSKTFMVILNWQKTLGLHALYKHISAR